MVATRKSLESSRQDDGSSNNNWNKDAGAIRPNKISYHNPKINLNLVADFTTKEVS
jgi:hypothetical protein